MRRADLPVGGAGEGVVAGVDSVVGDGLQVLQQAAGGPPPPQPAPVPAPGLNTPEAHAAHTSRAATLTTTYV